MYLSYFSYGQSSDASQFSHEKNAAEVIKYDSSMHSSDKIDPHQLFSGLQSSVWDQPFAATVNPESRPSPYRYCPRAKLSNAAWIVTGEQTVE